MKGQAAAARIVVLALSLGVGSAVTASGDVPSRTLSVRYEKPGMTCLPTGLGSICFSDDRPDIPILQHERRVRVHVEDDAGFRVKALVYDSDPDGADEDLASTCGPSGIAETAVSGGWDLWVDVYLEPTAACGDAPASLATSGTITVEFFTT